MDLDTRLRTAGLAAALALALPTLTDAQAVPAFSGRYRFMLTMSPGCPASMQPGVTGPLSIVMNVSESAISAGSEVSGASASPSEVPNQGRFVLQRVGNRVHGAAVAVESQGNLLFSDQGTVAVLGVEGLVVVRTGDAVLVLPRERAQEVRRVVEALEAAGRTDLL